MRHRATKARRHEARTHRRLAKRRAAQAEARHSMFTRMHKKFAHPQTTRPASKRRRQRQQGSVVDWLTGQARTVYVPAPRQRQKVA